MYGVVRFHQADLVMLSTTFRDSEPSHVARRFDEQSLTLFGCLSLLKSLRYICQGNHKQNTNSTMLPQ